MPKIEVTIPTCRVVNGIHLENPLLPNQDCSYGIRPGFETAHERIDSGRFNSAIWYPNWNDPRHITAMVATSLGVIIRLRLDRGGRNIAM